VQRRRTRRSFRIFDLFLIEFPQGANVHHGRVDYSLPAGPASFSTVVFPAPSTNSILISVGFFTVVDFSLP
jgi:hypothetical protein